LTINATLLFVDAAADDIDEVADMSSCAAASFSTLLHVLQPSKKSIHEDLAVPETLIF
jgi:hypothetical protein